MLKIIEKNLLRPEKLMAWNVYNRVATDNIKFLFRKNSSFDMIYEEILKFMNSHPGRRELAIRINRLKFEITKQVD